MAKFLELCWIGKRAKNPLLIYWLLPTSGRRGRKVDCWSLHGFCSKAKLTELEAEKILHLLWKISQQLNRKIWAKVQSFAFEIPVLNESDKMQWLLLRLDPFQRKRLWFNPSSQLVNFSFSNSRAPDRLFREYLFLMSRSPWLFGFNCDE